MSTALALPDPDPVGRAHGERLARAIAERIADGPLPFVEYMTLALYAPGLGYYMAGAPKFGAEGDFVTAPELSPLFGACLAAQCREVLDGLAADDSGSGAPETGLPDVGGSGDGTIEPGLSRPGVLELGAGSGRLAASLIAAFGDRALDYTILEPSPELRERQRALLGASLSPDAFARVRWVERLPERFDGVILANEVMDALPVERFLRFQGATRQVCVAVLETDEGEGDGEAPGAPTAFGSPVASGTSGSGRDGGGATAAAAREVASFRFADTTRPAPAALAEAVAALEADLGHAFPDGYSSELCPTLGPWIGALADALGRGAVLLADYGHPRRELYLPERASGTLACYYRHRTHDDPYFWPGLQDITAHVDFTAVAEAGTGAGLELAGYATQSAFLLGCGLSELVEREREALADEPARIDQARAVRTLTLPAEMGERFQFIAFTRGYDRALRGFGLQDLTHRL